jgi:outer membrane biogenesis lipoprotein LolB
MGYAGPRFQLVRPNMNRLVFSLVAMALLAACSPTVKVEAPEKPIEINLNVKIEHQIRVQVDKELESLFDEDSDVF